MQGLRFEKTQTLPAKHRLLSPEASYLVLDMLKNTPRPEESINYSNKLQNKVAWKTGTSSGYRDAWSIGVVGPYVVAVWIGNFDNKSNHAFVGKTIAAPLLFEVIEGLRHELGQIPNIEKKSNQYNLTQVAVCKASGMLPTRYCTDTESTWFIPGKSPIKTDTIYREVAIDKTTGLRSCVFNQNTRFVIYEFWSSDLLKIFKAAGIQRRTPPPYDTHCSPLNSAGLSPQIISPQLQLTYILRANSANLTTIPLTVVTDADVSVVYWFINDVYLGKTKRDQPYLWQAKAGKFVVRVVDDHGRSDARDVVVQMEN